MLAFSTTIAVIALASLASGLTLEDLLKGKPSKAVCGKQAIKPKNERIVGGVEAIPNSWPWLVALEINGFQFCGGTLIDETHVLTAAHCFQGEIPIEMFTVVAGLHYLSKPDKKKVQTKNITKIINHPGYSAAEHENDVCILRLASPVKLNKFVNIACLPGKDPAVGAAVVVAGWGTTKFGGDSPDELRQAKLEIMSYCPVVYPGYDNKKQLCAGTKQYTKDSCQGDSGGPLVYQVNGAWTLSGVVSYGDECAKINKPGVYARVSYYLDWIKKSIKS